MLFKVFPDWLTAFPCSLNPLILLLWGVVPAQHPVKHVGEVIFLPGATLDLFKAFVEGQRFPKEYMSQNERDETGDGGQVRDA